MVIFFLEISSLNTLSLTTLLTFSFIAIISSFWSFFKFWSVMASRKRKLNSYSASFKLEIISRIRNGHEQQTKVICILNVFDIFFKYQFY